MNAKQLAAAIGVNHKTLCGWNRAGYLNPRHAISNRSLVWQYSRADIELAGRMAALTNAGLTPRAAHRVASGDVEAAAAVLAAVDSAGVEPVLEPFRPDDTAADHATRDAMDLAVAVRDVDPRDLWAELQSVVRDEPRRLLAMVVALAAMVPVETPVSVLLAWTDALVAKEAA